MTAFDELMRKIYSKSDLPYHCIERISWWERLAEAVELLELFDAALCEVIQKPNVTVEEIADSVQRLRTFSKSAKFLVEDVLEEIDNRETIEERELNEKSE